jgi:hypothetical protein
MVADLISWRNSRLGGGTGPGASGHPVAHAHESDVSTSGQRNVVAFAYGPPHVYPLGGILWPGIRSPSLRFMTEMTVTCQVAQAVELFAGEMIAAGPRYPLGSPMARSRVA